MLSVAEMRWHISNNSAFLQDHELKEKIEVNCEQNMIKMKEAITPVPDGQPAPILLTVPQERPL